jgi:predicted DNA-binding transcriptional regulator AlpA
MNTITNQSRRLRTAEAAAYCGSTKSTFEKYRLTGEGAFYSKLGRVVVYDINDLDAWLDSKKRLSTSDAGSEAHNDGQKRKPGSVCKRQPGLG